MMLIIILFLSGACITFSAGAEWPMFRNNVIHSGASNITGNFSGVKTLWKYNAGSWVISSPSIADIDNDGFPEIVFGSGDGKIHVLGHNGTERWNKSVGYHGYDITSSPTLYDIDGDENLEIVVSTFDKVYMFNSTGFEMYNFSITNWTEPCLITTNPPMMISSPVVADINNDTEPEIVFGSINGRIYVLNSTFSEIWNKTFYAWVEGSCGAPVRDGGLYRDGVSSTPATADLDNDGKMEIIFQTRSGAMHVFHWDGTPFWNYTVNSIMLTKPYSSTAWSSPSVNENIILIGSDDACLYAFSGNGTLLWKSNESKSPIKPAPAVIGEMIVFGSGDGNIYCVNSTGNLSWKYKTNDAVCSSPAIADINNDTKKEIIIGSSDGRLYCLDENGSRLFSYQTNSSVSSSPAFADIDNDGNTEIIFGSNDGFLYVLTGAEPETDLRIGDIEYDGSLVQMDTLVLSVKVYNDGTIDSDSVSIEFFDNNVSIGSEAVDFVSVNEVKEISMKWIPCEEGWHNVEARVSQLADETNKENNNISTAVYVEKRIVDLRPVSENMIYLGETPKKEGDLIVIHAIVHNDGNGDAFNVNASVYVDETLIKILHFSSIPKDGSRDLSTYWIATHGVHTVKVVVEKNVYETNTSNNEVSVNINVQKTMGTTHPVHTMYEYWLALGIILGIIIYAVLRKRGIKQ